MNKFNPPAELILDGNLSERWTTWKREFQFYLTASESKNKPDEVKTSRLLSAIGPKSREIYYTFNFANDEESMTFDVVIQKFDDYFTPKKNITYQRYRYFSLIIRMMDSQLTHMQPNLGQERIIATLVISKTH